MDVISLDAGAQMLMKDLQYPKEKAYQLVKNFDHNKDGKLSGKEVTSFKNKIQETKKSILPKFKEYDQDNNGYVTLNEASKILSQKPFNFPSSKILNLLNKFDKDKNGKLDIEEFSDFYAEAKAFNEDISAHFNKLDKDKNGVLNVEEVKQVLNERLGFDESMCQHLIKMFDVNKDGCLDKTEFIQMWSSMFSNQ